MDTIETLIKQITVQQMVDYLVNNGWKEEYFGRDEVRRFCSSHAEYFDKWTVLIPAKQELVDYVRMVELAVCAVADAEERTIDDVLSDILSRMSLGDESALRHLLVLSTKEMGEIAECVVKEDVRPDHWKKELGDLCGLVIAPMLELADMDFDAACKVGIDRKREKMLEHRNV